MGCETDVKKSSYMRMSRTMPTAAMACLPAKSLGFSCFRDNNVIRSER
jgi:hypothetical protein